jgi:hypothetical protein
LKGTHPGTIPARLGLIWFSGFKGEDLNVKKKYRATRNLLKTGAKFRSTEDGFLSNVSLIFAL